MQNDQATEMREEEQTIALERENEVSLELEEAREFDRQKFLLELDLDFIDAVNVG